MNPAPLDDRDRVPSHPHLTGPKRVGQERVDNVAISALSARPIARNGTPVQLRNRDQVAVA
jgi:hypothetical protein